MAGIKGDPRWLALGHAQQLPVQPQQWMPYEGEASFMIHQNYTDLVKLKGQDAAGKLLDLSMFTDESTPLPYMIFKGQPVEVKNPNAPPELQGKRTVAGYPVDIWDALTKDSTHLPGPLRTHSVVRNAYFYQVHHDSINGLDALDRFLQDESGSLTDMPTPNPRRRIVVLLMLPQSLSDPNRFRKRRQPPAQPAEAPPLAGTLGVLTEAASQAVTVTGEGDTRSVSAIYEWWYGPAPAQAECSNPPVGHWKSYHAQVCRKLEHLYKERHDVQTGTKPMDVDGVRYMMQHITKDRDFNYVGQPSIEEFTALGIITIDHPCFSEMDRLSDNCFVQFRKDNPHRRRPARRRADAAETVARGLMVEGRPCDICYSEDGMLTGCNVPHQICKSCLRAALRNMAGDTLTVEHLICGCHNRRSCRALLALAQHADVSLQDSLANPPTDAFELQDFETEKEQTLRQFDLGDAGEFPPTLYKDKIWDWFNKVNIADEIHLYHVCSHPNCAHKKDNWMKIDVFERDYQSRGKCVWTCPDGHRNSVLPSQQEINEMNKSLLLHPEYYVEGAAYDNCPLRRYRLCAECVANGTLMLAVHGGECKQWPGYGRGHQHCFCFSCTRKWGVDCDHSRRDCRDPGVQQVRRLEDRLEIGFVDGAAYLQWLNTGARCPPTRFPSGEVPGETRQAELGLTDRAVLLAESRQGTT